MQTNHKSSQDFLRRGWTFSSKSWWPFFSRHPQYARAKTAKLTTPALQNYPPSKNYSKQVAQLSQKDRTAVWVSYGQKWKTGTGRQYLWTL